jgi:hypothetical protein
MYNLRLCLQPGCRILLTIKPSSETELDYSRHFDFVAHDNRASMVVLTQDDKRVTVPVYSMFCVEWDIDEHHSVSSTKHTRMHMKDGVHHRLDGPAVQHADGREEFWIEGKYYAPEFYKMALFMFHKQQVN